jgi:hypothetical protein
VPALARTDHVERFGRQAGRLGWGLDIGDLYTRLAVQPSGLLKQRRSDVHASDLAPLLGKQSCKAPGARPEIDDKCARLGDTPVGKAIE